MAVSHLQDRFNSLTARQTAEEKMEDGKVCGGGWRLATGGGLWFDFRFGSLDTCLRQPPAALPATSYSNSYWNEPIRPAGLSIYFWPVCQCNHRNKP